MLLKISQHGICVLRATVCCWIAITATHKYAHSHTQACGDRVCAPNNIIIIASQPAALHAAQPSEHVLQKACKLIRYIPPPPSTPQKKLNNTPKQSEGNPEPNREKERMQVKYPSTKIPTTMHVGANRIAQNPTLSEPFLHHSRPQRPPLARVTRPTLLLSCKRGYKECGRIRNTSRRRQTAAEHVNHPQQNTRRTHPKKNALLQTSGWRGKEGCKQTSQLVLARKMWRKNRPTVPVCTLHTRTHT